MKNPYRSMPCGCQSVPRRPKPDCDPCASGTDHPGLMPPVPGPCGGYLMQRILASGRLHKRCQCYAIRLSGLPAQAVPPFTVLNAVSCGAPKWEDGGRPNRCGAAWRVTVSLSLRVRDSCGSIYILPAEIEETLPLRYECPQAECWRGQPYAQAAVRLAGRATPCSDLCCQLPLEVMIEGYILCNH